MALTGVLLANWKPSGAIVLDKNPVDISTRHPVTADMKANAAKLARTPIPKFSEKDPDGNLYTESDLSLGKPAILIFVKNGCPCSIEAQPIFNDMARAFGGDAKFFALIDADDRESAAYADYNKMPFPIITDPDLSVIGAFKMTASAGFALLDGKGNVAKVWPGYSKEILREANMLLGTMSGVGPREFDDKAAPDELTAGCAFEYGKK